MPEIITTQIHDRHVTAVLNTTIITSPGIYKVGEISNQAAQEYIERANFVLSAIGHEATALAASELLGIDLPVNCIQYVQGDWDIALCLKIRGRLPEGQVLTREQMDEIGYSWWVMRKY